MKRPNEKYQKQKEQSETVSVKSLSLADIGFDAKNANKGSVRGRGQIEASLREFGFADAGTLDRNNVIIGGNKRTEVAGEIGMDEAIIIDVDGTKPVFIRRPDLDLNNPDDDRARRLAYALNRSQEASLTWDAEVLFADMQNGLDLSAFWNQDELDALMEGMDDGSDNAGTDTAAEVDRAEELGAKWQTAEGQIWRIGEHVVICGDCREPDTWQRLLQAANVDKVNGVFTSPPYAMQRKDQYGGVPTAEYVDWWEALQANVRANLASDGSFFVNIKAHCEDGQRVLYCMDLVAAMVRRWGWKFVDELCWVNPGVPGEWENRFKDGFEPVYHFSTTPPEWWRPLLKYMESEIVKTGWDAKKVQSICGVGMFNHWFTESQWQLPTESHYVKMQKAAGGKAFGREWSDLKNELEKLRISMKFRPNNVSYISENAVKGSGGSPMNAHDGHSKVQMEYFTGKAYPSNVVQCSGPTLSEHAAAFPVALPDFFIRAYSDPGDVWADPFLGSGTSIVAAHNNKRRGLGSEKLPKYLGVILERLATHTSTQPELISN